MNGIHIGGKMIKKISGPVSMYYVTPPSNSSFYGPPILLFGDYHRSYDNMCKKCYLKDNCYPISHDKLYSIISTEKNADVYIETFPNTSGSLSIFTEGFKGGPIHDVISKFSSCFPNVAGNSKSSKSEKCKNIRWHTADSRLGSIKYSRTKKIPIESLLFYPYFCNQYKRTKQEVENLYIKYGFLPSQSELDNIRIILRSLIVENSTGKLVFDIQGYVDTFFSFINTSNSLIAKQISKQQGPLDINFWKKVLNEMLSPICGKINIPFQRLDKYRQFVDVYGSSDMAIYSGDDFINDMILLVHNTMLDLYFLTRVFKRTSPSFLTVCYFGNLHSLSILHTLINIFRYQVKFYENQSSTLNRCVEINMPLYLDDDIKESKEKYDKLFLTNFSNKSRKKNERSMKKKIKECPDGKERNPETGRCIKIKKSKEKKSVRKIRKPHSPIKKSKVKKECPDGKVRNPVTGRCVKVKDVKSAKIKSKQVKECPDGKVRNPATGRCIKVKK